MNEAQELRRLIPLNTLSAARFEQVAAEMLVEDGPKGTILFHQGEPTQEFVYILSGTVSLQAGGVEMDSVTGGTETARFALAHQNPRKVSAVAKEAIRYTRIRPEFINQREEPPIGYTVSHTPEAVGNDWISALLRSPVFRRLTPSNLQSLLRSVEEISTQADEVICRQDDPGDYFYIIKQGQCVLTRKPSPQAKEIKLATLKDFDTFGEDALIADQPRSVTVKMAGDGVLLRLDKASFLRLVGAVIPRLEAREAIDIVRHGGGAWLDVRLPDAYQQGHPKGASNAPFFSLRMMLSSLDRQKKYVLACDNGKLCAAGAYLLLRHGFDAYALQDGIDTLPAEEIAMPSKNPEWAEPPAPSTPPAMEMDSYLVEVEEIEPGSAWQEAFPAPTTPVANPTPAPPPTADPQQPDAELRRLAADKQRADAELAQARLDINRLEASLWELRQHHERLLGEWRDTPETPADAKALSALQQEIERANLHNAELRQQQQLAEQTIADLEKQVGELKVITEEFIEQGASDPDEEREALRAELDMVRQQAGAELSALQARLAGVEADNARLRNEAQTIKTQLTVREAVAAAEDGGHQAPARRSSPAVGILLPVAIGLLAAVLVLGGLLGLDAGRGLLRTWLGAEPAPAGGSAAVLEPAQPAVPAGQTAGGANAPAPATGTP